MYRIAAIVGGMLFWLLTGQNLCWYIDPQFLAPPGVLVTPSRDSYYFFIGVFNLLAFIASTAILGACLLPTRVILSYSRGLLNCGGVVCLYSGYLIYSYPLGLTTGINSFVIGCMMVFMSRLRNHSTQVN